MCSVAGVRLVRVAERLAMPYQDDALRPVALVRRGGTRWGEAERGGGVRRGGERAGVVRVGVGGRELHLPPDPQASRWS